MRNLKFFLICGLLVFSGISLAQEEIESDAGAEEVDVQVPDEEEPPPEAAPEEPAPIDTTDTGTIFQYYLGIWN